jgi:hypothetical protein
VTLSPQFRAFLAETLPGTTDARLVDYLDRFIAKGETEVVEVLQAEMTRRGLVDAEYIEALRFIGQAAAMGTPRD